MEWIDSIRRINIKTDQITEIDGIDEITGIAENIDNWRCDPRWYRSTLNIEHWDYEYSIILHPYAGTGPHHRARPYGEKLLGRFLALPWTLILAWRDISVRYKQTIVGILWQIIRPFLTMIVPAFSQDLILQWVLTFCPQKQRFKPWKWLFLGWYWWNIKHLTWSDPN